MLCIFSISKTEFKDKPEEVNKNETFNSQDTQLFLKK